MFTKEAESFLWPGSHTVPTNETVTSHLYDHRITGSEKWNYQKQQQMPNFPEQKEMPREIRRFYIKRCSQQKLDAFYLYWLTLCLHT